MISSYCTDGSSNSMVIKIIMTIIVVAAIKIHQPGIPNLTVSRVVIKLSKVKKKRAIERTKKQI